MKLFVVIAMCLCAASAAFSGYTPSSRYQPGQQAAKVFAQASVTPFGTAPAAAANSAYKAAQYATSAPVVAVKAVYNTDKEADAAILRSESDVNAEGYNYQYETANGIASQASGIIKEINGKSAVVSQGSYKYIAPDGTLVEFSYIADENGYQPISNQIPVAPPVPKDIARSLEYNAAHPQKPENY